MQRAATVSTVLGAEQVIARGPAATQVAIKQLGTNGGGFFAVNSPHPLENPTIALLAAPGVTDRQLAGAAWLASMGDDTPEGKSVVDQAARLRARVNAQRAIVDRINKRSDFSRRVAVAASFDDVVWAAVSHVAGTLECHSILLAPDDAGILTIAGGFPPEIRST